jgi:glycosyltransferase involved in cell wall biosynthesis
LLRAARVPCAVNTDGLEWERGKWNGAGRAVFRFGAAKTARWADALVCDSQAIGRVWHEQFGRDSTFIPYGAPVLSTISRDRLSEVGLADAPYALVVARLAPENNVELTLDALELLGGDAPHAVIVGSANFDAPIESRLRQLDESGRITWLGHVADQELLTALWAHCDVYVHGHSVGGTNPALLQALGAGAPTLAFNSVFNAEVLPFADQRYDADVPSLAGMIRGVIEAKARQAEFRRRGQEVVHERYSWDDVCQRYEELLLGLATRRAPR